MELILIKYINCICGYPVHDYSARIPARRKIWLGKGPTLAPNTMAISVPKPTYMKNGQFVVPQKIIKGWDGWAIRKLITLSLFLTVFLVIQYFYEFTLKGHKMSCILIFFLFHNTKAGFLLSMLNGSLKLIIVLSLSYVESNLAEY